MTKPLQKRGFLRTRRDSNADDSAARNVCILTSPAQRGIVRTRFKPLLESRSTSPFHGSENPIKKPLSARGFLRTGRDSNADDSAARNVCILTSPAQQGMSGPAMTSTVLPHETLQSLPRQVLQLGLQPDSLGPCRLFRVPDQQPRGISGGGRLHPGIVTLQPVDQITCLTDIIRTNADRTYDVDEICHEKTPLSKGLSADRTGLGCRRFRCAECLHPDIPRTAGDRQDPLQTPP